MVVVLFVGLQITIAYSLLLVSDGVMWHLLSNLPIRVFQYWNNIATQMKFCQLLSGLS